MTSCINRSGSNSSCVHVVPGDCYRPVKNSRKIELHFRPQAVECFTEVLHVHGEASGQTYSILMYIVSINIVKGLINDKRY